MNQSKTGLQESLKSLSAQVKLKMDEVRDSKQTILNNLYINIIHRLY